MSTQDAARLFAQRLREMRKDRNLTQERLAKKADLTASAISQFETGEREPTFSSLVKLARALEVSPSYLAGLEEYDIAPAFRAFYREHQGLSERDLKMLKAMAAQLKQRAGEES